MRTIIALVSILLILCAAQPLFCQSVAEPTDAAQVAAPVDQPADNSEVVEPKTVSEPVKAVEIPAAETTKKAPGKPKSLSGKKSDSSLKVEVTEIKDSSVSQRSGDSTQPETATESEASAETPPSTSLHPGRPDKIALLAAMEEGGGKRQEKASTSVGDVFTMMLKLGIVLVMAYFSILALKRLSFKGEAVKQDTRHMRVLGTTRLSQTNSLHMVNVNGKLLLIGSSASQVSLVQDMGEFEERETEQVTDNRFAEYLAKYSNGRGQSAPAVRLAGMLRDCTEYFRNRYRPETNTGGHERDKTEK